VDAQLAVEARGRVLEHVPTGSAAEDLEGTVGDAVRHLRREQLRHRDLAVDDVPVLELVERVQLVALEEGQADSFGLAVMRLDRITTAVLEDAIAVIGERAPRQAQLALATVKLA
jgi:hypothetical protein